VTRAEADQRRGRAGRVAPGRLLPALDPRRGGRAARLPPPEIETADLAGLALELALWGEADAGGLPFLTPAARRALAEARALLAGLGALDAGGPDHRPRPAMAALPLHPRLAHMLLVAGPRAAPLAALSEAAIPCAARPADLALRLDALAGRPRAARPPRRAGAHPHRGRARWRGWCRTAGGLSPGAMASLAYPDRIGLRRPGRRRAGCSRAARARDGGEDDPLAAARLIVATDLDGDPREARIRQAAALPEADLRDVLGDRILRVASCAWSKREGRVRARLEERLGALAWPTGPGRRPRPRPPRARCSTACATSGSRLSPAARASGPRRDAARPGHDLPDLSDTGLMARLEDWLLPHLGRSARRGLAPRSTSSEPLRLHLGWERLETLDRLAPARFHDAARPRGAALLRAGHASAIAVRLQEMFGVRAHPVARAGRCG
jgi:ATP-dependent helicase HrpB